MTKFEEEVKRPKKAYIDPFSKRDVDFTGVAKKFTEAAQTLKEWKEYAFLHEDKLKLQQQALPVVPECVGEFVSGDETKLFKADRIAYLLKSVEGDNYYLEEYLTNAEIISQEQGEHLYAWATNQTHETILELWNGYTVEKPQLFYLKNRIELEDVGSDLIGYLNLFLTNNGYLTNNINRAKKFTQQEIESVKTGSYELVPVEDGE